MRKTILIIGPVRSGKTRTALQIASGSRTFIAEPAQAIDDYMLSFIPSGTEKLIIEGSDKLLNEREKLNNAMTLVWVNGLPAPEMILTTTLKRNQLPDYLVMNDRITLVDLWSDTPYSQVI